MIYRSLKRIEETGDEPVTLEEAKHHLGVDSDFTKDDTYIESLVKAARVYVEDKSATTVIESLWQMKLDKFPCRDIRLPNPPLIGDSVEVWYVPVGGTELVQYENFIVDADSVPGVIRPNWNEDWPEARGGENDVVITYDAGPSAPSVAAKHCILLLVGSWYITREAVGPGIQNVIPMAFDVLFNTFSWAKYGEYQ